MKKVLVFLGAMIFSLTVLAAHPNSAPKSNPGFEKLKTLYTPDGDRLVMTHYCSSGNQPRMQTPAIANGAAKFDFSFIGITNLSSPEAPHMNHLVIQIADNNHFTEDWTWQQDGKNTVRTMQFVRKQ